MEVRDYQDVLRAHRLLVTLSILLCTLGAAALAWTRAPTYVAEAQLFVSTGELRGQAGGAFESGLYAQQRARSYAELISTQPGAQAAADELGLTERVESVQKRIRATVPRGSVLINVNVTDRSPEAATAIADSVAGWLPELVQDLDGLDGVSASPIRVTVTKPAELSTAPATPRPPVYIALGAVFGIAVGVGGAVLRRALDRRVADEAAARTAAGAPVIARIPRQPKNQTVPVILGAPRSAGAEGYRRLRATLRSMDRQEVRSLVVSSAVKREGKTDVVANIGVALAGAGEDVVVVDANLRSPKLGEVLGVRSEIGLTEVLASGRPLELALRRHPVAGLWVLTSGSPQPNPSELLDSEALDTLIEELSDSFAFVVVDSPPLLAVADAAAVARRVSGAILVARRASTKIDQLAAARRMLRAVDARLLGVVLTGVPATPRDPYLDDGVGPRAAGSPSLVALGPDGDGAERRL